MACRLIEASKARRRLASQCAECNDSSHPILTYPYIKVQRMAERLIVDQREFESLCQHIREAGLVAFDTEFVSEHTYRPELCLLQFATRTREAAVDPFELDDLTPWWDLMLDPDIQVVVHGGQAEVRFCLWATGQAPQALIDVQLAEGLRSRSYPLAYTNLVSRVVGKNIHGKETRTDWRRRPLTPQQIAYALEDVEHVLEIWDRQRQSLQDLGRLGWAESEFERYVSELEQDNAEPGWKRLAGIHRLHRRELAIAIRLFDWRESEAERRNRPQRRILRDDLLLDIARRKPRTVAELLATRDMNRSDYRRVAQQMLDAVDEALQIPDSELPPVYRSNNHDSHQDEQVLSKLLGIALSNRCAEMNVSLQLVGTTADLRELVRAHLQEGTDRSTVRLNQGWRSEVCGALLTDILEGKLSLRVANLESDHPLVFERIADA